MQILLISANTEQLNMPTMPLGLAAVAAALEQAGHRIGLLDLMFSEDAEKILVDAIEAFRPECLGISVRNIDDQNMADPRFLLEKVREVVAVCRRHSDSPIVLGGAGYSMFPEAVLDYLEADFGIAGEGETAFPAFLKRLEDQAGYSELPGLYVRKGGVRGSAPQNSELDLLPLPDPEILAGSASRSRQLWVPVQTRRGCGLGCSYCSTATIEGATMRQRSPEIVADWLQRWLAAGCSQFFFVDNTFNLPLAYAKAICRRIIDRNLAMRWRCIIYPGQVNQELVGLMAAAGCRQVSLGFESGSKAMLKALNKHFSPADIRSAAALFADHDIERMGFLLLWEGRGKPGKVSKKAWVLPIPWNSSRCASLPVSESTPTPNLPDRL